MEILWLILLMLLNTIFVFTVILFETSSKKIIFWSLIITLTSILGYIVYLFFFSDKGYMKKRLEVKSKEDDIYNNLVEYEISKETSTSDFFNFVKNKYHKNTYKNSAIKLIKSEEEFSNLTVQELENAKKFIIITSKVFLNSLNKDAVVSCLIEKQSMGVNVKVVYFEKKFKDRAYVKELIKNGVRCCKFNKTIGKNDYYKNNKNIISIDGEIAYLYPTISNRKTGSKRQISYFDLCYELRGDIVKEIDLEAHKDVTFATKKFYGLTEYKKSDISSNTEMMYCGGAIDNNFIGLILKATIEAKKSIYIHVDKFIPNDSILEAIKLASKSNIDVRIMISNVNRQYGYYTSRSYVKELAREGVTCYFYDGHINSNYIVVDEELVFASNFSLENLKLICDLQDVLIIHDTNMAKIFLEMYNKSILNSYKLSNPKKILFREKFFRKLM